MHCFKGFGLLILFFAKLLILLLEELSISLFNLAIIFPFRLNTELVESLSRPTSTAKELNFPTKYSQSFFHQFLACLWKQNLSYWRNPQYTAVRCFYTVIISLMLGTICWRFGAKRFPLSFEIFLTLDSMKILLLGILLLSYRVVVWLYHIICFITCSQLIFSLIPLTWKLIDCDAVLGLTEMVNSNEVH